MPTVVTDLSHNYLPSATDPIGFQATFKAYDETHGGGQETFVTVIQFLPDNVRCWSLSAAASTGSILQPGTIGRIPADPYDPQGITASWTGRISDNPAEPTEFFLKALFDAPSGFVQVQASCTQQNNADNHSVKVATVPIPPVPH